MAYSLAQLEALWQQAAQNVASQPGVVATYAPEAAAIAQAESGGDATNVNPNDPSGGSFGLWQINGVHASALEAAGLSNWQTDPLQNAEAAVMVFQGAGNSFGSAQGGPWAAEFIPNSAANARYNAARANEAAGNLGAPASWTVNPVQATIGQIITGNNGTATAGTQGQASTPPGVASNTTTTDPVTSAIGAVQTAWSSWWTQHPAWLVLAGIVLALIAWSLIAGSNTTVIEPSAPSPKAVPA